MNSLQHRSATGCPHHDVLGVFGVLKKDSLDFSHDIQRDRQSRAPGSRLFLDAFQHQLQARCEVLSEFFMKPR